MQIFCMTITEDLFCHMERLYGAFMSFFRTLKSPHSLELHGKVWPAQSSEFLLLCSMMMIINFGWTTCVPLKLSVLMRRRCDGQSEGFVWFRIRVCCLLGSQSTSAERMRMRLKQVLIKCHHSLHAYTFKQSLKQIFKVKRLPTQQCLCISFFLTQ